jgi:hypothetical protein
MMGALVAAFLAEALSVLVAATPYFDDVQARRFLGLSNNPFAMGRVEIPFAEHRLRILGPTIAWALGLRGKCGVVVPIAANIPMLMMFYVAVRRRADRQLALAFVALLATTHVTMTSRTLLGYHDSLVFLCLTVAMLSRSAGVCVLAFFLSLFGDPRAFLTMPLIVLWRLTEQSPRNALRFAAMNGAALAVATVLFFVLAMYLTWVFGYSQDSSDRIRRHLVGGFLSEIRPGFLQLSGFMTFKAGWIFPLLLVWAWAGRRPMLALIAAADLLVIMGSALLVQDVSRAMTFCFPALLLAVLALHRSAPGAVVPVTATSLLVNLISPFYHGMGAGLWVISYPLPVELARWAYHHLF